MKNRFILESVVLILAVSAGPVSAAPTFQAYIDGATAGTVGSDSDTWFFSGNSFNLIVVGAWGPKTVSQTGVTLVVSVPQGQKGTLSVTGNGAALFSTGVTADILTDIAGNDGFSAHSFLPTDNGGLNDNQHYPFKEGVSDYVLFSLGSFGNVGNIHNYNASDGSIAYPDGTGEEKTYSISMSGFDWAHFDVFGLEKDKQGQTNYKSTWDWNAYSHDSTATPPTVPAPGAIVLGTMGIGLVGFLRRRNTL